MVCPHIETDFKINCAMLKIRKCQLIEEITQAQANGLTTTATNNHEQDENSGHILSTSIQSNKIWKCSDCKSAKDNWICLSCGNCGCGKYEKSHAIKHFTAFDHKICINVANHSIYCYKCDDFVVNETPEIENIGTVLKFDDTDTSSKTPAHSNSTAEDSGSSKPRRINKSKKSVQETASISSNDSGLGEDTGRKLRLRNSVDNSSAETLMATRNQSNQSEMKAHKVIGLRNLGNTCFMNSVLQSLSNIQEFSFYFNQLPSLDRGVPKKKKRVYDSRNLKENRSNDASVVEELRKILINLNNGNNRAISPVCLFSVIWKVVPQFKGDRQHDAHEFLRYMLDRLHTEFQNIETNLNGIVSGKSSTAAGKINSVIEKAQVKSSIVTNVFGGTLQSEVRCLVCGKESKKSDPFLDLSLDIPERFFKKQNGKKDEPLLCNLSDCLYSFTAEEELSETELYYCNSCKCKQRSTKRFSICRLPHVLCLHVKRFRWKNFYRTKIDSKIKFPIKSLDMSQYVLNNGPQTRKIHRNNNYDLAAVIVHHGNGSSCGHYTSYALNEDIWLHFNDHQVHQVPVSTVADCKPYILFYIKRNMPSTTLSSCASESGAAVANGCSKK